MPPNSEKVLCLCTRVHKVEVTHIQVSKNDVQLPVHRALQIAKLVNAQSDEGSCRAFGYDFLIPISPRIPYSYYIPLDNVLNLAKYV